MPPTHHLFDGRQPTVVFTYRERATKDNLGFVRLSEAEDLFPQIFHNLYQRNVQSVLVEGGPTVLNSLLKDGLWDEIRILRSPRQLGGGVAAPSPGLCGLRQHTHLGDDELFVYVNDREQPNR